MSRRVSDRQRAQKTDVPNALKNRSDRKLHECFYCVLSPAWGGVTLGVLLSVILRLGHIVILVGREILVDTDKLSCSDQVSDPVGNYSLTICKFEERLSI